MNLKEVVETKKDLISVYFTAGFPHIDSAPEIMKHLEDAGADILEIGIPFSDPVADGPTIQGSNDRALKNGMTMNILFEQLADMKKHIKIPVILMGYLNPVMQYGVEKFCETAGKLGLDGIILPDLPISEYESEFKDTFVKYGLSNIFLITPQTPKERIHIIDKNSDTFIYAVSSTSITGARNKLGEAQIEYLKRLQSMNLKNPFLVGFGISNNEMFREVCTYSKGAIIGSAFINMLEKSTDLKNDIYNFVTSVKGTS